MRINGGIMKLSTKFGLKFGLLFISTLLIYSCATTKNKTTDDDSDEAWIEKSIKYYSTEAVFHENPEDVQIISQDFDAFWQAVDASRQPDGSFDPKIFQQTYQTNKTGKLDAHSEFFYGTKERLYDSYGLIPFYESFRESMLENGSNFQRGLCFLPKACARILSAGKVSGYVPLCRSDEARWHLNSSWFVAHF